MAVNIDGSVCSTLDNVVTCNDERVIEIWANGTKVYPEPQTNKIKMHLVANGTHKHLMNGTEQVPVMVPPDNYVRDAKLDGINTLVTEYPGKPGQLYYLIMYSKSYEAKYWGDLTVTVESSKPLSQYVGHFNQYGEHLGNSTVVSTKRSTEYGMRPMSSVGYPGGEISKAPLRYQPFCVEGTGEYWYTLRYNDTRQLPLFDTQARLTFTVEGQATCKYEFHDETGFTCHNDVTKNWDKHYKSFDGKVNLIGTCIASEIAGNSEPTPINGDKTLLVGSRYGRFSSPRNSNMFYPQPENELVALTDIMIAMSNPTSDDGRGSIICPFVVKGFSYV